DLPAQIDEALYLRPVELVNARLRFVDNQQLAGLLEGFPPIKENRRINHIRTVSEHVFQLGLGEIPPALVEPSGFVVIPGGFTAPPMDYREIVPWLNDKGADLKRHRQGGGCFRIVA